MTGCLRMTPTSYSFLLFNTLVALITNEANALSHFRCNVKTSDRLFFPDQLEYLQVWASHCACDDLIYWPPNNRCYKESTQGPCSIGRILVFDRTKIEPRCETSSEQ
ncbi:hypothetical protein L798_00272 [Zootermopsis nevadensis]|uniref:DUF4789 domain-containing protein n=1 Tax=Zootermopsis nevadensis TaxID=136037 RepID=A0A067QN93_ZOONE|nr:hypothetical protein L798_00272 [Zootermopsis nevadensis]